MQHGVNYWGAQVASSSETGRVFFTGSVTQNTFEWDANFLSSWATAYVADGNNPAQSSTPPTVTIGSGFSAEAPGPYGSPRFPWTVGNAMTENGNDQPIFIDPVENVVTVQGNATEHDRRQRGRSARRAMISGQVYAAIVNGVTDSAPIPSQTYNNEPYYPFNLDNLDISGGSAGTSPPPVIPAAPTNLKASTVNLTQVNLVWATSSGASSYIVERSVGGTTWSTIATNVVNSSYANQGLSYSTTYLYRVLAVSSAGQSSPSSVVSVRTGAHPDVLAMQPMTISATRKTLYSGPVAIFTDANLTATAGSFTATIRWGDGAVTAGSVIGNNGYFVVTGAHTYRTIGSFAVSVTVSMVAPGTATASTSSVADVVAPPRVRARRRSPIARRAPRRR